MNNNNKRTKDFFSNKIGKIERKTQKRHPT